MAKGGMRIGEVLKIRPIDIKDRTGSHALATPFQL
jgi:hypothetical protein